MFVSSLSQKGHCSRCIYVFGINPQIFVANIWKAVFSNNNNNKCCYTHVCVTIYPDHAWIIFKTANANRCLDIDQDIL